MAFKHNIRDEWLARHLGQERLKSMAALTTLMTRFCMGEDSWLARGSTTPRNYGTSDVRGSKASHDTIDINVVTMATTPKTRQSMPDSAA